MSDRPDAANGKRSTAWGTTGICPACGRCLCFGCHPDGPCVDQHDPLASPSFSAGSLNGSFDAGSAAWGCAPGPSPRVAGLQMRSRSGSGCDGLS